jgi:hypothetical protein
MKNSKLFWQISTQVMHRDYHLFMSEHAQKELYALRILELCLTGK